MATKDVSAPTGFQVPDPDCAIGGSADEGVFACCESPDAAFVSFEGEKGVACQGRVYVDGVVV